MRLKVVFLLSIVLLLFLIGYSFSVTNQDFTTGKTCSQTWGLDCNSTLNDAFNISWNETDNLGCNGVQKGTYEYVKEVYINASAVRPSEAINVTCEFYEKDRVSGDGVNTSEYLWYYNGSGWYKIYSDWGLQSNNMYVNRSFVFNVNTTEGQHIVRCNINHWYESTNYCNSSSTWQDTDDVNFTVVRPLQYNIWNLSITNDQNLTRSQTILAYAQWNKNLSSAIIQHNGNGSYVNFSIISNFAGNWTNYTLVLSNTTEFSTTGIINVSYIWANESFGLDNYTSPSHYFYLWGSSKVSNITINDSVIYNESSVQVSCKVEDNATNSGISNYNVSFYENDTFLNTVSTNSTGGPITLT